MTVSFLPGSPWVLVTHGDSFFSLCVRYNSDVLRLGTGM